MPAGLRERLHAAIMPEVQKGLLNALLPWIFIPKPRGCRNPFYLEFDRHSVVSYRYTATVWLYVGFLRQTSENR